MTYCRDEDLVLDTGRSIDAMLDNSLNDNQKKAVKEDARTNAFNIINDQHLLGKTAIPAGHIPTLKEIEKHLALSLLLRGAYTLESPNRSEWIQDYEDKAIDALGKLRFCASAEDVVPDEENTGDGTVTEVRVIDEVTMTETWVLKAISSTEFSVYGTKTGYLRLLTVDIMYPEKDWVKFRKDYNFIYPENDADLKPELYPIRLTVNSGNTDFVEGDKFTFRTFSASYRHQYFGDIMRG
jgi:hypothetical protein